MPEPSPRPDTPGTGDLPFAALLDDVRARGVGVGLHEYNAVGKLLSRWQGASPEEFGVALAALLARDEKEAALVKNAFRERYLREPASYEASAAGAVPRPLVDDERASGRTQTLGFPWWKAIAAGAAVVALVALLVVLVIPRKPARVDPDVGNVPPPRDAARQPPTDPAPASVSTWTDLLRIGAIAGGVWAIAVIAVAGRRTRREWVQRVRRASIGALDGPYQYVWNVPLQPVLTKVAVEDMASVLGRTFPEERPGRVMDVDETIRRTLRAGLWAQIAFKPSVRQMTIVVLRDVSADMRPWLRMTHQLLDELRRQGIALDLWTFDRNPAWIARGAADARVPFSSLGARATEEALIVIGTGSGLAAARADLAAWAEHAQRWDRRVWLNPIRHPDEWDPVLHDIPLGVWPMTAGGLLQAAIEISSGQRDARMREALRLPRRVTHGDIDQMKRLLAFAPQPTIELAEALRAQFCPDVPREVVLHLPPPGAPADRIALSQDEARTYVVSEEQESPDRAKRIRAFLGSLLARSEPTRDSAAHLRWELDAALLALGRDSSSASPRDALVHLADSPIAREVSERIDRLAPSDPASRARVQDLQRTVERRAHRPPSNIPANVRVPQVPMRLLSVSQIVGAIVVAALAIVIGRVVGVSATATLPHLQNAYRLEYLASTRSGPRLDASIQRAGAPDTVQLYRESDAYGPSQTLSTSDTWQVTPQAGGTYYQVRGRLADGRMALSNWVWVPAPVETTPPPNTPPPNVPPKDTPPAARATLEITRIPDGLTNANVSVDGTPWSGGPALMFVGMHRVEITHPMYSYSRDISLTSGQTMQLSIDAQPVFGIVDVQTNVAGAKVLVTKYTPTSAALNSRLQQRVPREGQPRVTLQRNGAIIRGETGAFTLEVSAQYHVTQTINGQFVAGQRTPLKVELKRDPSKSYDNAAADTTPQVQQGPPTRSVEGRSGQKASGIGQEFSPWYEVCADVPAGAKITAVTLRLEGDRTSCGNWAECRESSRKDTSACYVFRLQGHDEQPGRRFNSEGIITVTFVPPPASRK